MKILIPAPNIKLYQDGFKEHDKLNLAESGRNLSKLVEKIEDPLVIALDGKWGSGKSFFLKCWVGAHTSENEGTAKTVYFDAFAHDYIDDPLISLTSTIEERFPKNTPEEKALWKKGKNAVAKLARPASRIILAAATAGASEIAGSVVGSIADATKDELNEGLDSVWVQEAKRRDSMKAFRDTLMTLTKSTDESGKPQKVVVAIDELDRCRPDYALLILETIKHFFNVPNIHFILGVNLHELANSVRMRYGAGVDAEVYLQKFVTLSMTLPDKPQSHQEFTRKSWSYFNLCVKELGVDPSIRQTADHYFKQPRLYEVLTLRTVEKLATYLAIANTKTDLTDLEPHYRTTLFGLILLKICFPNDYRRMITGKFDYASILRIFGISIDASEQDDHSTDLLKAHWAFFLNHDALSKNRESGMHFRLPNEGALRELAMEYIETFNPA